MNQCCRYPGSTPAGKVTRSTRLPPCARLASVTIVWYDGLFSSVHAALLPDSQFSAKIVSTATAGVLLAMVAAALPFRLPDAAVTVYEPALDPATKVPVVEMVPPVARQVTPLVSAAE